MIDHFGLFLLILMQNAHKEGLPQLLLRVNGMRLVIAFRSMVQLNTHTGGQRPIRRIVLGLLDQRLSFR
jgi:hypothetical protein